MGNRAAFQYIELEIVSCNMPDIGSKFNIIAQYYAQTDAIPSTYIYVDT